MSSASAFKTGQVALSDGVRLSYIEAGTGKPLVMVPGWSQTAIEFKHQLEGLSSRYRVVAFDPRGQGESDKPDYGYRLSRLAMDLREVLDALGLDEVTLLGHSLGASTIWCFWELFGAYRVSRFVFVDQPPYFVERPYAVDPVWQGAPASVALAALNQTVRDLAGPNGSEVTRAMLASMVSPEMPKNDLDWLVKMNLRMPRGYAARMLYNGAISDWRDTIPRITLPTLIVSGRASHIPWQSQVWINQQIAGSKLMFMEAGERGRHFMFLENPDRFNQLIADYLG
jgi:pimeloyl-ACP methyl ester carboxylesterase